MTISTEQITQTKLGTAYDQVVAALGAPLKETRIEDVTILRYNSPSQRDATFLYFKNNELVQKSVSTFSENETLQKYVTQFGAPSKSIQKFKGVEKDENFTVVHLWPEKGIAIVTYGLDLNSKVERYQEFVPSSMEEYFQTWGKELVGNVELNVPDVESFIQTVVTSSSSSTSAPTPTPVPFWQDKMVTSLGVQVIFTIVIGLAFFVLLIKRQLKR